MSDSDKHDNNPADDFFSEMSFKSIPPAKGKVLISEPFLFDPFFKRSVVLLTAHDDEGSVGFILNRPIKMNINEIVQDFPEFDAELYFGGPVGEDQLFYIHRIEALKDSSREIMKGLYWGGDYEKLQLLIETGQVTKNDIRFFIGYSGWDKGQLLEEMKQKSWIVAKTDTLQIMKGRSKQMWKKILEGLGKKFAIMANFPEDPTLN